MPIAKYDKYFGGKGGASKAKAAMAEQYGAEKGESVFYALKNKRKAKAGDTAPKKRMKMVMKHGK